jgi:hypothetical protein
MILDERLEFGENFDLDQETGSYLFTNQIDLGLAGRDIGNGKTLYLVCVVTEAFTDGGDSATLTLQVRSDDSAAIHASTSSLHVQTKAMLKTELTIGTTIIIPLPPNNNEAYERYLGLQAVVATAGFDDGMITAGLTTDPSSWKHYADAI